MERGSAVGGVLIYYKLKNSPMLPKALLSGS